MSNFDRSKYKYWTTYILEWLRIGPIWVRPFIFVGLLFLGGFFMAMVVDFHYQYATAFAVGVGLFGILYALVVSVWLPDFYVDKLLRARSLFDISDREYYGRLDKWLSRQCNNKISLGWALVGAIAASIMVNLLAPYVYSHDSLRFLRFFPSAWYRDSYPIRLLSVEVHWFFVIALIVTGCRALVINIFLMKKLCDFKVALPPRLTEIEYKSLADVNLLLFSNWCVGASLCIIVVYKVPNVVAIVMTIFLTLIGLLTFGIPQYYLYRNLRNVKRQLIDMVKQVYKSDSCLGPWDIISHSPIDFTRLRRIHSFNQIAEAANNIRPGLYNVQFFLIFLGSALIPVLTLIITLILKTAP